MSALDSRPPGSTAFYHVDLYSESVYAVVPNPGESIAVPTKTPTRFTIPGMAIFVSPGHV
jgi:hypothetical protein